jgi:hypothetical protein
VIEGLIGLIVLLIVVGIVCWIVLRLVDMLPMEGSFKQIAQALVILVAVLIVLYRALPLIGVSL